MHDVRPLPLPRPPAYLVSCFIRGIRAFLLRYNHITRNPINYRTAADRSSRPKYVDASDATAFLTFRKLHISPRVLSRNNGERRVCCRPRVGVLVTAARGSTKKFAGATALTEIRVSRLQAKRILYRVNTIADKTFSVVDCADNNAPLCAGAKSII